MPKGYRNDGQPRRVPPERRCTVCRHEERARIELMHCAGVPLDKIAARFGVHRDAIWRHMERHVSAEEKAAILLGPAKLHDLIEATASESASLRDYYSIVRSVLFGQLMKLAKAGDHDGVAKVSARITHVLRDIAKMTGELSTLTSQTIVNVNNSSTIINSAPFADLQRGLLEVCARHPDARADIVTLFHDLDAKYAQTALPSPPICKVTEAATYAA